MNSIGQPSHRQGFTLVELLIATALMMVLLSLVYTVWRGTQRAVERARSLVILDLRTRVIADRTLEALDNRSGCLPMALQNEGYGPQWPFRVRVYMANSHISGSGAEGKSTPTVPDPSNYNILRKKKWVRDQDGEFQGWRTNPATQPAMVGKEAGLDLVDILEAPQSGHWGAGVIAIWHGTAVPIDAKKRYLTGESASRAWGLLGAKHLAIRGVSNNDIDSTQPSFLYRGDAVTTGFLNTASLNPKAQMSGPYRGTLISPWCIYDGSPSGRVVSWLAERHALRIKNGPAFFNDPRVWGKDLPFLLRTGIYGVREATLFRQEPNWLDGIPATGITGPRPAYGSIIEDNGISWRVEAPSLYIFGPSYSTSQNYHEMVQRVTDSANRDLTILGIINAMSIGVFSDGNIVDFPALPETNFFDTSRELKRILQKPFSSNVSDFDVTTGKAAGISGLSVPLRDVRGRFGSLVVGARALTASGTKNDNPPNPPPNIWPWDNRDWAGTNSYGTNDGLPFQTGALNNPVTGAPTRESPWDNASNRIGKNHSAGYQGSEPTGMTTPGHPEWTTITIGVVGGFSLVTAGDPVDRRPRDGTGFAQGPFVNPQALERRWTIGSELR